MEDEDTIVLTQEERDKVLKDLTDAESEEDEEKDEGDAE